MKLYANIILNGQTQLKIMKVKITHHQDRIMLKLKSLLRIRQKKIFLTVHRNPKNRRRLAILKLNRRQEKRVSRIGRLNHIYKADLSHRAVSVYIYLYDRANKDDECWPSNPTIAKELKLSESTVRRALKDLRKEGFIVTEQRYRKHGGKSSLLYKLKMQ